MNPTAEQIKKQIAELEEELRKVRELSAKTHKEKNDRH